MRYPRLFLSLAVAGALAALAFAGPAEAAAACSKTNSRTIAKNSVMRIYKVQHAGLYGEDDFYGCIFKRNKSVLIDSNNNPQGFSLRELVLTRGDFVAFFDDQASDEGQVEAWNLRTGKRTINDSIVPGSPTAGDPEVSDLVANGNGSIAWIAKDDNSPPAFPTTVQAHDGKGQRTLDTGAGINSVSLTMASNGLSVSWIDNGVQQSAPISP